MNEYFDDVNASHFEPPTQQIIPGQAGLPDLDKIPSVSSCIGSNAPMYNLKDHPEFADTLIVIHSLQLMQGEMGEYVILDVHILHENKKENAERAYIATGAANVVSRALALQNTGSLPARGMLRLGGRAWFLD